MAKAQQKKTAAKPKKVAAKSLKKKTVAKKPAKPAKPAKKPAKKPAAKKPVPKKAAEKVKKAVKAVKKSVAKVVKPAKKAPAKPAPKAATKPAPKAAPAKLTVKPVAVKPAARTAPKAVPPPPAARPAAAPEAEKKRGRRARPRVHSTGAPVAAWLSTEKPRSASFIPAPPRAEAPSAIAAPPASSDRLIRPDDIAHPSVRTVPVRIDIEQGAGRFYVIASPLEVTVRVSEGIEWDFRYVGGADVTCDEIVIEFDRPSPFSQATFRSRRPGGARPHRQLSGPALPSAAGKRIEYTVRAINAFKTEIARTKVWLNVTA
jgi:hypothetical protein